MVRNPDSALRVLVLGGTGFIGPRFVEAALERGHRVAVFNRGGANDRVPTEVERLTGDRATDLDAIAERDWDAVIDLAAFVPRWVRFLGERLEGRVGHYTFISTHYVYQPPAPAEPATEDTPVREYGGPGDPFALESLAQAPTEYGSLKVLCEREAERWFPGRVLIERPGYIVGPGDPQPFLSYLPMRMARGGEMLMPGSPETEVQFVDVRDLAEFAIHQAESGGTGVYNMAGPTGRTTVGELLEVAAEVAGVSPTVTWVPSDWLAARDAASWMKPLFWSPDGISAWVTPTANARALAAGATFRPRAESVATVHADARATVDESAWDLLLELERETLAAWRVEGS
jgi:2'-hydroxyisoflavone reductase